MLTWALEGIAHPWIVGRHASLIPERGTAAGLWDGCSFCLVLGSEGALDTPWTGNKGGLVWGLGSQHNWGSTSMGGALITQVEVAEWAAAPAPPTVSVLFSARAQAHPSLSDCQLLSGRGTIPGGSLEPRLGLWT